MGIDLPIFFAVVLYGIVGVYDRLGFMVK